MQLKAICLQKKIAVFRWTVSKTTNLYYILKMSILNRFNLPEYELCQVVALY